MLTFLFFKPKLETRLKYICLSIRKQKHMFSVLLSFTLISVSLTPKQLFSYCIFTMLLNTQNINGLCKFKAINCINLKMLKKKCVFWNNLIAL